AQGLHVQRRRREPGHLRSARRRHLPALRSHHHAALRAHDGARFEDEEGLPGDRRRHGRSREEDQPRGRALLSEPLLPRHIHHPHLRSPRVTAMIRLLVAASLLSLPAAALDPFEIQVYDGTANSAGEPGLELHLNYVARGLRSSVSPELPPNRQAHATLEPSYGVTSFWELGGYLQGSLRPDGTFDYAGAKLRSKFVTPPGWHEHLRLGINLELSLLPASYDRSRWGAEVRPNVAVGEGLTGASNRMVVKTIIGYAFGR